MGKVEPVNIVFHHEKDTKNKGRFQEQRADDKTEYVVDKLYVNKKTLKKLGDPDILHVHIDVP